MQIDALFQVSQVYYIFIDRLPIFWPTLNFINSRSVIWFCSDREFPRKRTTHFLQLNKNVILVSYTKKFPNQIDNGLE